MNGWPTAQGCDLDGAAEVESGLEHRLDNALSAKSQAARRLQRQHLAERVHRLGPRVLFELLDELDRHHGLDADLDQRLAAYAALDPAVLAEVGGDRFATTSLRLVAGGTA